MRFGMMVRVDADTGRPVVRARYVPSERAWLVKAYGFCWTMAEARKPNAFGKVDPRFVLVKSKRAARKLVNSV